MATINVEFGTKHKDGFRNVYFIVVHNRTKKRIQTQVRVTDDEIAYGRIKNIQKARAVEMLRRELEDRLYELSLDIASVGRDADADYVVRLLLAGRVKDSDIDFFEFADEWLKYATIKGKKNYVLFLNRLEKFLGVRRLPFSQIKYDLLQRFEVSFGEQQRGKTLYLGAFRHLFREAMRRYNSDEEQVIKNDPFTRFRVPKQVMKKGVRSVTIDELLRIYNYNNGGIRATLARDCFILSFCLMGMNSADLYDARTIKDGVICYKRMKTRGRRSDEAYIEVKVHPILEPLMKKYKDRKRVFDFHKRYCNTQEFNRNLNIGLKQVGEAVGIDNLQFYQARHTFATLSRNLMKFSKSDVDEALNHIGELDIADIYIKRDFSIINDNNFKLIDKVFGESAMI